MKLYSFCTRWYMFLTEIPLSILFWLTCQVNSLSTTVLKYYPLLIALAAAMIFLLLFFFRTLGFSYDEVRMFGLFSSRDKAILNEGKTLILTQLPRKKLKVEVYGNDGVVSGLSWLEGTQPQDIYLFRAKTLGGKRKIEKILSFYGIEREHFASLLAQGDSYDARNETTAVHAEQVDGNREIRIRFLVTMEDDSKDRNSPK